MGLSLLRPKQSSQTGVFSNFPGKKVGNVFAMFALSPEGRGGGSKKNSKKQRTRRFLFFRDSDHPCKWTNP